jgi:hypothetical protein
MANSVHAPSDDRVQWDASRGVYKLRPPALPFHRRPRRRGKLISPLGWACFTCAGFWLGVAWLLFR